MTASQAWVRCEFVIQRTFQPRPTRGRGGRPTTRRWAKMQPFDAFAQCRCGGEGGVAALECQRCVRGLESGTGGAVWRRGPRTSIFATQPRPIARSLGPVVLCPRRGNTGQPHTHNTSCTLCVHEKPIVRVCGHCQLKVASFLASVAVLQGVDGTARFLLHPHEHVSIYLLTSCAWHRFCSWVVAR